jgi:rhodanese-related sulfurtransferase
MSVHLDLMKQAEDAPIIAVRPPTELAMHILI